MIPALPWRGITLATALLVVTATAGWEVHCRSMGYSPTLNDDADLWATQRRKVQPDSLVIVGDSRAWFDLDLDELEKGFGQRPIQLAIPGSCAFPILEHFANDPTFHGTIICSLLPGLWIVPFGQPVDISKQALHRYEASTVTQRISHRIGMNLEENIAFLRGDDLTLPDLLKSLEIPNRAHASVPPEPPPYFCTVDRDRRARMIPACETPGPLQTRVKEAWIRIFRLPSPPPYVPPEAFREGMQQAIAARFRDTAAAVARLREHGAKIVFVRFPVTDDLRKIEDEITPRAQLWDPLVQATGAPSIYFADEPDLASFTCPEWSHLSAADSVEFTRRLIPHLKHALGP